jgi:hypothetical protein
MAVSHGRQPFHLIPFTKYCKRVLAGPFVRACLISPADSHCIKIGHLLYRKRHIRDENFAPFALVSKKL